MNPERWQRIKDVAFAAMEQEGEGRRRFLDAECGSDTELRRAVEDLLEEDQRPGGTIERGIPAVSAKVQKRPGLLGDEAMIGRRISHYEIVEKLGGGGMGVVYKARDLKLDRFVALKFLPREISAEEEYKRRFIHEAKAASALDHNNICTIHEIDETADGQLFIAMAYYAGETLKKKIQRSPLPLAEAFDYGMQVAQGLAKAHRQDIVHRDIKPANVMVTEDGVVKIVDFGLAQLGGATKLTKTGSTMGTPAYMSPEQAERQPTDRRTDIWSLGVVLYEMVTGRVPFEGERDQAVLYAIAHEEVEPMTGLRAGVPIDLDRIVGKAMAKDPTERYQHVEEMLVDLRSLRRALGLKSPKPSPVDESQAIVEEDRPTAPLRSRTWRAAVAALVLIALTTLVSPLLRREWEARCLWAPDWFAACRLPADKHVGMLAFENLATEPDAVAIGDGLVETLTNKLNQLASFHDSLCVHAPRSDRQVFGVRLVLSGTVQRNGDVLRLAVRLSSADSSLPLRVLTYEGELRDVNAISAFQDTLVERLAALLEIDLPEQARVTLAAGGTAIPAAFEAYLTGLGYLSREDLENAERLLRLALGHDQYYALAHAAIGDVYRRKYELTEEDRWIEHARESCLRAIEQNDQLASAHLTVGQIESRAGRYEQASEAFQRALDQNPVHYSAQHELANAYIATGRLEEAESVYLRAIELRRNCWRPYNSLGIFYDGYGRYDDAEKQFHRVVEVAPNSPIGYTNLGNLYVKMERYDEAAKVLEVSLRIQERPVTYSNLGWAYFSQGCYADAAPMFLKAVDLGLNNYFIWGNLAEAYLMVPKLADRAHGAFRKAIELAEQQVAKNPASADLHMWLANHHARLGDKQKALAEIREARRLAPQDINVLFRAALVYEMTGQRDQAFEALQAALEDGYSLGEIRQSEPLESLRRDPRYRELDQLGYSMTTKPTASAGAQQPAACPSAR